MISSSEIASQTNLKPSQKDQVMYLRFLVEERILLPALKTDYEPQISHQKVKGFVSLGKRN